MPTKLDGSYEFSELTQIEGIFVSSGREKASGKIIQIHLFPAGKAEQANRICQMLLALPEDAQKKILRYGQEGSASYFVTEPLPEGEYLQSWVERQSNRTQEPHTAPEVSSGLTDQLRRLAIRPSPLAPVLPGPQNSPAGGNRSLTPPEPSRVSPATEIPGRPGELTSEFRSLYGDFSGSLFSGSPEEQMGFTPPLLPAEPPPKSPAADRVAGLETWLNLDSAPPARTAEAPPMLPPNHTAEEPPRKPPLLPSNPDVQRVGDFTRSFQSLYGDEKPDAGLPAVDFRAAPESAPLMSAPPPSRVIFEPAVQTPPQAFFPPVSPPRESPRVQPASSARAPVPLPPSRQPRAAPRALDWKTVLLIVAALVVVAALIVGIVETSGQ
jgi:hypothetical protein